MRGDGIEGGDVGETELAKGRLDDGDAGLFRDVGCCSGVDGLYDLVDVGGDKRVYLTSV